MSSTINGGEGTSSNINHDILLLDVAFKGLRIADDTQTDQDHYTHTQVQVVPEKLARLKLYTRGDGVHSHKRQRKA